jgi:hypothetical protein
MSLDLQSNTPRSWKLRHAFEKITNTGISAMHERDYLQERLQAATKRREAVDPQPKPRKRRRIPEEGLILKNKEELRRYFDDLEAKSNEVRSSKLQKLREKVEKLDVRVRDLMAKKEKYCILEREGKLPATWKSVARLEEEEQKEIERLNRMKEDVLVLEQELEERGSEMEHPINGVDDDSEREEFVFDF